VASVREIAEKGYVAFSTSQARYVATYQLAPPGALGRLESAVATSPRFRLWHATEDARLYELLPDSRPAAAAPVIDPSPPAAPGARNAAPPRVYRIEPGDTLSEISARFLGSSTRWAEIAELNHLDPKRITPGETIRLPSRR
jgi:LysM repeat protein